MPAVSEKQREMMAIAEHHPEKLHKKNKGVLKMSHSQLHDFASKKKEVAHKMGVKKTMRKKMMEENRKHPTHGYRHLLSQGSSKKYMKNMEKNADDNIWKYVRENRTSDKRIF